MIMYYATCEGEFSQLIASGVLDPIRICGEALVSEVFPEILASIPDSKLSDYLLQVSC